MPYTQPEFTEAWQKYKLAQFQHNRAIVPVQEIALLKDIKSKCGEDVKKAVSIIELNIKKGWLGFTFPNNNKSNVEVIKDEKERTKEAKNQEVNVISEMKKHNISAPDFSLILKDKQERFQKLKDKFDDVCDPMSIALNHTKIITVEGTILIMETLNEETLNTLQNASRIFEKTWETIMGRCGRKISIKEQ